VARAKRTARADARRRYRADQGLPDETTFDDDAAQESTSAGRSSAANQPAPPARIGIGAAFRQSFRPLDLRGDLRALPAIAIRSKAFLVPVALTIIAAVLTGVTRGVDVASMFAFTYFIYPPAIGGVFIAGFMAPRASWLLGIIVGLVASASYSALGYAGLLPADFQTAFAAGPTAAVTSSLFSSLTMGAIFASAAAWYRRFLQLSNPNRGRSRAQPPAKRGSDGRSRAGNQKAGIRR
jgi:hypothetical protein